MIYRIYIGIIVAVFLCQIAGAQEKPLIRVVFEIREKEYQDFFAIDRSNVEKTLADSIVAIFNQSIPFLSFQSDSISSDSLLVYLEKTNGLDLKLILKGKNIFECDPVIWEIADYRNWDDYMVDNRGVIFSGIPIKIRNRLYGNMSQTELVDKVFRYIKISGEVDSIDFPNKQWILPFTYEKLKVGMDTQFSICQWHRVGSTTLRECYEVTANGIEFNKRLNPKKSRIVTGIKDGASQRNLDPDTYFSISHINLTRFEPIDFSLTTIPPQGLDQH